MTREQAKELFRNDKDAFGKPKAVMSKIDAIFDSFENKTGIKEGIGEQKFLKYQYEEDKKLIYNSVTDDNICMYFYDENRDLLLKALNNLD